MSQSNQVQNPYANRYDSISETGDTGVSSGDYDQFDGGRDPVQAAEDPYGMDDLQRIQDGQGDRPSDAEIFSEIDPNFFGDDADPETNFDGTQALKNLADKIQKTQTLSEEEKNSLLEELGELQQQYLEGSIDNIDLEYEVEALGDKIISAKEESVSQRKLDIQVIKQKLETLLEKDLEELQLDGETIENFRSDVHSLEAQLAAPGADLKTIQTEIKALKRKINREVNLFDLTNEFQNASSAVPKKTKNWKATQEFTILANEAMETGNWAEVIAYLEGNQNDGLTTRRKRIRKAGKVFSSVVGLATKLKDKNDKKDSHRVVQQFVGTLFHKLADSDQDKFDALLSLIPKNVIQSMISVAEGVTNDAYSGQGLDNPAETAFYGTPMATAQRLRDHLDWNSENYFNNEISSTDSLEYQQENL